MVVVNKPLPATHAEEFTHDGVIKLASCYILGQLAGQLLDISSIQTQEVEDID